MDAIVSIDFFGLKLSSFTIEELEAYIVESIRNGEKRVLFGYSLGALPYFKNYPDIAILVNQFDISVADGRGLYILAKTLGYDLQSDISIPNLSNRVLYLADKFGCSVMIVGSTPENNAKATVNARSKFPNATIFDGYYGGSFENEDEALIVERINNVKPDILFIGVSSPKKERFAAKWKDSLDVKIIIPFGGAIDILSGKTKPIPKFIKKIALGGLYRWIQEPRRLFRDSLLYSFSVLFGLIPILLFNALILRNKSFSIPIYYNKKIIAPIKY